MQKDAQHWRATSRLLVRCLVPSGTSGTLCILLSVIFVVLQAGFVFLQNTTDSGNGEWVTTYRQAVSRPLLSFINSPGFGDVVTIFLWALLGFAVYIVGYSLVRTFRDFHDAEHDIQVLSVDNVVRHPLQRSFVTVLAWRLCVLVLMVIYIFVAVQVAGNLLAIGGQVASDPTMQQRIIYGVIAVVGWALMGHVAVALVRLYAMRTRLFGGQ
jgi:hypothetical protein